MRCLYCSVDLAPLRALVDGEFCCDQHRRSYQGEQLRDRPQPEPLAAGLVLLDWPLYAIPGGLDTGEKLAVPLSCRQQAVSLPEHLPTPSAAVFKTHDRLLPLSLPIEPKRGFDDRGQQQQAATHEIFELKPHLPNCAGRPEVIALEELAAARTARAAEPIAPVDTSIPKLPDARFSMAPSHPANRSRQAPNQMAAAWNSLSRVWKHSPSDLKLLTMVMPVLVVLAFTPSLPKVHVGVPQDIGIQRVVSQHLESFRQQIVNRAAVDYTDDFRSGLDDWQGRQDAAVDWSYDQTGFVRPGALALFHPTLTMSDYRFEFLGEIDQRGMGCVFRAVDTQNYYAVKLMIVKPGPLPMVRLVRYAVIDGKEQAHTERPLPILARTDTVYRVLVDVRGDDFTIMTQGQVVDFWTDGRLKKGGVGLFCARGEKARVRWVEISHQYDALGRLCAYLAPYGGPGRIGNWN